MTTASKLVSLVENPKTSPNHCPQHNQSDVPKTPVSADLIMSFPCLNPFKTHCPNVPPTASTLVHSPLFPPPSLTQHSIHAQLLVVPHTHHALSPELVCVLFLRSGMFSSTFYLVYTKLSFRLQSRCVFLQKPPLTLRTRFCALR